MALLEELCEQALSMELELVLEVALVGHVEHSLALALGSQQGSSAARGSPQAACVETWRAFEIRHAAGCCGARPKGAYRAGIPDKGSPSLGERA